MMQSQKREVSKNKSQLAKSLGSDMERINNTPFLISRQSIIGEGNLSTVHAGFDQIKSHAIAIKFIEKSQVQKNQPLLERECLIAQDLTDGEHPNIIKFYGYDEDETGMYLYFEYCSGGDLNALIRKEMSEGKIFNIFSQIVEGMIFLHQKKIIHGDLKPPNIMITEYEQVKIIDFGSAKFLSANREKASLCQLPHYSPPEILNHSQDYDEKSDVWSAGLILYKMVTGKHLFGFADDINSLKREVSRFMNSSYQIKYPQEIVDEEFKQLIKQMLVYDHRKRPSFEKIKAKLSVMKTKIKKDSEYDSFLSRSYQLLQSRNPWSNQFKGSSHQKYRNHIQSYHDIEKVLKFTSFTFEKNKIHLRLLQHFQKYQNKLIKNVYKYLLMYLSISMFLKRSLVRLERLSEGKIQVEKGVVIEASSFSNEKDLEVFFQIVEQQKNNYASQIEKSKKRVAKIIKKIQEYLQRVQEKKDLQEYRHLVEIIQKTELASLPYYQYHRLYGEILFSKNIPLQAFNDPQIHELKTHIYIFLVYYLDTEIKECHYMNNDYISKKNESIQNETRQQKLLWKIAKLLENENVQQLTLSHPSQIIPD